MPTLDEIVREIDRRSADRPFGSLQPRRKRIKGLARMPCRVPFAYADHEHWAFHVGGRTELQFNVGLESGLPGGDLRYGVAFSFETSQALPNIDILLPKAARFNDYLRENAEELSGFLMWLFDDGRVEATREGPYSPRPIPLDFFRPGGFVFLGCIGNSEDPDYANILDALDALLPLWEYSEAGFGEASPIAEEAPPGRRRPPGRASTIGNRTELTLDIKLRHNVIADRLYKLLVEEHGQDCVDMEFEPRGGGRIDAIVRTGSQRVVYEIKTASNARGCVREAMGQLLDYGCWPDRVQATRLVVVGSEAPAQDVLDFLDRLSGLVPLRIEYRQIALDDR